MLRNIVVGCLALVILGGAVTVARAQDGLLGELYGRGVHAYFDQDYEAAFNELSEAIDQGSKDPRCYYYRGLCYLKLGRPDEARGDFESGAKLEVAVGERYYSVGRSLERVQGNDRLKLEGSRQKARVALRAKELARERTRYEELREREEDVLREAPTDEPAEVEDPGGTDASDPFDETGESIEGDATEAKADDADAADAFGAATDDAEAGDDSDPFGGGGDDSDPFGGADDAAKDAADDAADDAGPFGGGADDSDPFGDGAAAGDDSDPFGDDAAAGDDSDPFGGGGDDMAPDAVDEGDREPPVGSGGPPAAGGVGGAAAKLLDNPFFRNPAIRALGRALPGGGDDDEPAGGGLPGGLPGGLDMPEDGADAGGADAGPGGLFGGGDDAPADDAPADDGGDDDPFGGDEPADDVPADDADDGPAPGGLFGGGDDAPADDAAADDAAGDDDPFADDDDPFGG